MNRILYATFALTLLTAPAFAGDKPSADGCYRGQWFTPWLSYVNCTHPARDDAEQHVTPEVKRAPEREPPHECPYGGEKPDYQGGERGEPRS